MIYFFPFTRHIDSTRSCRIQTQIYIFEINSASLSLSPLKCKKLIFNFVFNRTCDGMFKYTSLQSKETVDHGPIIHEEDAIMTYFFFFFLKLGFSINIHGAPKPMTICTTFIDPLHMLNDLQVSSGEKKIGQHLLQ